MPFNSNRFEQFALLKLIAQAPVYLSNVVLSLIITVGFSVSWGKLRKSTVWLM